MQFVSATSIASSKKAGITRPGKILQLDLLRERLFTAKAVSESVPLREK